MLTKEFCCQVCEADCCRYVMLKINPPRLREDRDEHRWLLMHEDVELRIESRMWYAHFHVRCRHLSSKNLCLIYQDRPDLCEDYTENDCDYGGPAPDTVVFKTVEEYDEYMAKHGKRWISRKRIVKGTE